MYGCDRMVYVGYYCDKKLHFFIFFIDNEKGIPLFKFAALDYGYSGFYLKKCKVTGNPTLNFAMTHVHKMAYD